MHVETWLETGLNALNTKYVSVAVKHNTHEQACTHGSSVR